MNTQTSSRTTPPATAAQARPIPATRAPDPAPERARHDPADDRAFANVDPGNDPGALEYDSWLRRACSRMA